MFVAVEARLTPKKQCDPADDAEFPIPSFAKVLQFEREFRQFIHRTGVRQGPLSSGSPDPFAARPQFRVRAA